MSENPIEKNKEELLTRIITRCHNVIFREGAVRSDIAMIMLNVTKYDYDQLHR